MPHQQPGRRARLAWALLGLTVALVAAAIAVGLARGERWNAVFGFIPVALAFTVVGALVAARTGNRLGWLFLVTGTLSAATLCWTTMPPERQGRHHLGRRGRDGSSPSSWR
jgi:hypothetical protein